MDFSSIDKQCAKAASVVQDLAKTSSFSRRKALLEMASSIQAAEHAILAANQKDCELGKEKGLTASLIDRLALNPTRLKGILDSILQIADLPDPIGEVLGGWVRPNGLRISKIRVPIGVIAMIYEARPNVTADAAALGIKTGNVMVLRGSASAYHSNAEIIKAIREGIQKAGLNPDSIQFLTDTTHEGVHHLVSLRKWVNLAIPRGSATLINQVVEHAKVPTIETGIGNCHIFVDADANLDQAEKIIMNAKIQRPSVCNSCETILIHQDIAATFVPKLARPLIQAGVELRGCEKTQALISCTPAQSEDWDTEFLDLILAVKVVKNTDEAITHIVRHTSNHSEAILSNNLHNINRFKSEIDAAAILVNTSTRFVDGGEFGFGAELGISTQKLHARGPMGLPELTTYKYIVEGDGQIRE